MVFSEYSDPRAIADNDTARLGRETTTQNPRRATQAGKRQVPKKKREVEDPRG